MSAGSPSRPPAKARPAVRALCRRIARLAQAVGPQHGYAIGVHGSLARDLDLIAVVWTDDASEPLVIVKAIQAAITADIGECYRSAEVEQKPQGRLAWVLHFQNAVSTTRGAFPWVDLSVIPPRPR